MKIQTLAVLLASLVLLAPMPTLAGDDDAAAAKKHIAVLLHEAKALQAEGRHDAADVLRKRAHELKARFAKRSQGKDGVPLTMDQARKVLHGLEMGMEALKTLRREKELKALARIANEIRERMQKAQRVQKAQAAGREKRRGEHSEIQEAKRQLEILRVAFHGLREGEKHEAMERMEHAIHALELGIEGRRDDEALKIRKSAPDREERIELLRLAARIWDGFGHEGKAQTLRALAEKLAGQARRTTDRRERQEQHTGTEHRERVEHLQHQVHELRRMMEQLQEHVRHLEYRLQEDED